MSTTPEYKWRPTALPSPSEWRARAARRRRRQQVVEPAPAWPPEGTGLPDADTLELLSQPVLVPCAGRLVAVEVKPKPVEGTR